MSGFSEWEVEVELERRSRATRAKEAADGAPRRKPPIHCQTPLSFTDQPPLCEHCLGA